MPTFIHSSEQLINVGDEIPIKLVKVKERTMTEQEAIEILKAYISDDKKEYYKAEFVEAHELAISALEKQIPKKMKPNYFKIETLCPNCGYEIEGESYCPECGQKVLWFGETE